MFSVLCSALSLLFASGAQPIFSTVETLEWMAADSRVIVRGAVLDYVRDANINERAGTSDSLDTIVIRVSETLKGEHKPFVTFTIRNLVYQEDVPRWKQTQEELLVFLVESKRTIPGLREEDRARIKLYSLTPRYVKTGYQAIFQLGHLDRSHDLPGVYTVDLKILSEGEKLLEATRAAVEAGEQINKLRSHAVRWPQEAEIIDRVVPVDGRLEQQALKWVASEHPLLRAEGAKVLRYFSTDNNVALLKALLNDSTSWVRDAAVASLDYIEDEDTSQKSSR